MRAAIVLCLLIAACGCGRPRQNPLETTDYVFNAVATVFYETGRMPTAYHEIAPVLAALDPSLPHLPLPSDRISWTFRPSKTPHKETYGDGDLLVYLAETSERRAYHMAQSMCTCPPEEVWEVRRIQGRDGRLHVYGSEDNLADLLAKEEWGMHWHDGRWGRDGEARDRVLRGEFRAYTFEPVSSFKPFVSKLNRDKTGAVTSIEVLNTESGIRRIYPPSPNGDHTPARQRTILPK